MSGTTLGGLARGSALYGVGVVVNRLMAFLLLPLFTRYLAPEDYGVMAMLALVTVFCGGLFSLGAGNALPVCYFAEPDEARRPSMVWSTTALLLANVAVWCTVGALAAPVISRLLFETPSRRGLVVLVLLALGLNTVALPLSLSLRIAQRARAFVLVSLASAATTAACSVLAVVVLGRGVRGMLEASVAGAAVLLVLTAAVAAPRLPFGVSTRNVRDVLRVGAPSIAGVGAFFVLDFADRALLKRMVGLGELGIYSVGYSMGMMMVVLVDGAFGSAWPPFFAAFVNRQEEACRLFGRVFRYCLLGYGTVALGFFLFARPVVALLTAPEFHPAFTVVGIVASAYMLKVCYLVLLPGLYFHRKLHLQAGIEWVAAGVNVGLNLLLIPLLAKEGAALATLGAYLSLTVLAFAVARRYLPVHYDGLRLAACAGLLAAGAAVSYLLAWLPPVAHAAWGVVLMAAFAALAWYLVLDGGERRGVVARARAFVPRLQPAVRRPS